MLFSFIFGNIRSVTRVTFTVVESLRLEPLSNAEHRYRRVNHIRFSRRVIKTFNRALFVFSRLLIRNPLIESYLKERRCHERVSGVSRLSNDNQDAASGNQDAASGNQDAEHGTLGCGHSYIIYFQVCGITCNK